MGCGSSKSPSQVAFSVLPGQGVATLTTSVVDTPVHVTGVAAPFDTLLRSPCDVAGTLCVAAIVKCYNTPSGNGPASNAKLLFTARAIVPFKLVDPTTGASILVDASLAVTNRAEKQVPWQLSVDTTAHCTVTHNIQMAEDGSYLSGGGEKPGFYNDVVPLPDALPFWTAYNAGLDPPGRISVTRAMDLSRPRTAKSYLIRPGDRVGVTGRLARSADGELRLVPSPSLGGGGPTGGEGEGDGEGGSSFALFESCITNNPRIDGALHEIPASPPGDPEGVLTGSTTVLRMDKPPRAV